ncbi:MAG: pyruvate, phosphate dikinase [Bacteroidales bacterium]|nr:pyruvate, phosphate dikinase [Bacteroidales bacterium]
MNEISKIFDNEENLNRLLRESKERLKELNCINKTTDLIKQGLNIDETLQAICNLLPPAYQYPEYTVCCIEYDGKKYISDFFIETQWLQQSDFVTAEGKKGSIKVYYTKEFPRESDEGPFLVEERNLINNIATLISNYINSQKIKEILHYDEPKIDLTNIQQSAQLYSRQLLQKFINKDYYERDIYHDLMPFKVKEILLIANLYDAFSIEKEGRFTEHILGEYYKLNLTSLPRITGVSSEEEALFLLKQRHFDLIIIMMGSDKKMPFSLCETIKANYPYISTYLLLNNDNDIQYLKKYNFYKSSFDKVFVWNGDSKIFFAMVKLLEDKVNIENDSKLGVIHAIVLVEDSPKYYSRFLPALYNAVLEQTQRLIEEVNTDELYKVLKLRARPKILHACTYEEAMSLYERYKDIIICLITDIRFPKGKKEDPTAGFQLVDYVQATNPTMPILMQSSDAENMKKAFERGVMFLNKSSDSLIQDLKDFIIYHLGFGHFVFRSTEGKQLAIARNLKEFENLLKQIPDESLTYHALKNHFSLWMMARGEIEIARKIKPYRVQDFKSPQEIREFLLKIIQKHKIEKDKGKIVQFDPDALTEESNIVTLSSGSLGGKGRGLAFVNTLIYNYDFSNVIPGICIRTPVTSIIGTDEFDYFLHRNKLYSLIHEETDFNNLKEHFVKGELSYELMKKLKIFIKKIKKPLAVRSSSLLEDSLSQPFSGVFETYLLPNNHPDESVRLQQLATAIKLVYASVFSPNARLYFDAIQYKVEEEKMAVVIQEVVGREYHQYYYPHISGTAQSHNFYPVGHMKPEEGFAVIALGLGQYVVEGEKTYRFSPRYPKIDIMSLNDIVNNSQTEFFAINLKQNNPNLMEGENASLARLDLYEAEMHETLKHLASVYNPENDTLEAGLSKQGPRVVNFANILKYEYIPLAQTIEVVLSIVKEAMGTPVEIEFAVDLEKNEKNNLPSFYLLQIKPLLGSEKDFHVDFSKFSNEKTILRSSKSMGNGKIEGLQDIIFVIPEAFNNLYTEDMALEIEQINRDFLKQNKKYILIGPGRWGTRDKFIGIPVVWSQISAAKVIVETELPNFPLDASLGSHFFHNVTAMNVGYFSVKMMNDFDFINWELIQQAHTVKQLHFFKHVHFNEPVSVYMDGSKQKAIIVLES